MRLVGFLTLMVCITVSGYMLGYSSVASWVLTNANPDTSNGQLAGTDIVTAMIASVLNPTALLSGLANVTISNIGLTGLIVLGVTVSVAYALLMNSFAAMYIIPIAIVWVLLNIFIFPINFIFDTSLPIEVLVIIVTVYNLLMITAIMRFVRGSD